MQRTPYGKANRGTNEALLDILGLVNRGIAVLVQDVRGRFKSGGRFVPFLDEAGDTQITVNWIRNQPWSNGRVSMFGNSYMGLLQWQAAANSDSGLDGIMPAVTSTSITRDWLAPGGARADGFLTTWLALTLYGEEVRRNQEGSEALEINVTPQMLDDVIEFRPSAVKAMLAVLRRINPALWSAVTSDQFIAGPAISDIPSSLTVLSVAGAYDIFVRGSLDDFAAVGTRNKHQVIGPWAHGNYSGFYPDRSCGTKGSFTSWTSSLPFLDTYLDRVQGGARQFSSIYSYFIEGPSVWETSDYWPPSGTEIIPLKLLISEGRLVLSDPLHETETTRVDAGMSEVSLVRESIESARSYGGATFLPGLGVSALSGPREIPGFLGDYGTTAFSESVRFPVDLFGSPLAELKLRAPRGTIIYGVIFHIPAGSNRRFLLSSAKQKVSAADDVEHCSIHLDFSPISRRLEVGDQFGLLIQLGAFPEVLEANAGAEACLVVGHESGTVLHVGMRDVG